METAGNQPNEMSAAHAPIASRRVLSIQSSVVYGYVGNKSAGDSHPLPCNFACLDLIPLRVAREQCFPCSFWAGM